MAYSSAFPADNAYVKDIPAAIRQKGEDVKVPSGMVMYFAGAAAPTGWLACNGSAVSRTTYAELFAAIGTTYGSGNGTTTFNLPDLRGEFVRGLDSGRGIDSGRVLGSLQAEDYKGHTHTGSSGSTGAHAHGTTASSSSDGAHSHTITSSSNSTGAHSHTITSSSSTASDHSHTITSSSNSTGAHTHTITVTEPSAGAHTHSVTVGSSGGSETRPRNIALLPCIKV